jgi:hypothetical protein
VSAAVLSSWRLRSQLYRLQLDLEELRQAHLKTLKQKAATERWSADKLKAEAEQLAAVGQNRQARNPWDIF